MPVNTTSTPRDGQDDFFARIRAQQPEIEEKLIGFQSEPGNLNLADELYRFYKQLREHCCAEQNRPELLHLSEKLEHLMRSLLAGSLQASGEVLDGLFNGSDLLFSMLAATQQDEAGRQEGGALLKTTLARLDALLGKDDEQRDTATEPAPPAPPSLPTGDALLREFQIEAGEHIETSDKALLALDNEPADHEAINELFRSIHSIKGTSAYLALETITSLAHAFESLLELVRRQEKPALTAEVLDLFFETLDCLRALVSRPADAEATASSQQLKKRLQKAKEHLNKTTEETAAATAGTSSPDETTRTNSPEEVFFQAADQHFATLENSLETMRSKGTTENLLSVFQRAGTSLKNSAAYMGYGALEQSCAELEPLSRDAAANLDKLGDGLAKIAADLDRLRNPQAGEQNEPETDPAPQPPQEAAAHPDTPPKTMRIDQHLLDTFMNLVGELVVIRNVFTHVTRKLDGPEPVRREAMKELRSAAQEIVRISEKMQSSVMDMRMVPVRTVFQRFPRIVRDITRKTGKKVRLVFQGEETEIDKGIAEDIADPLVHLIRNAVDHGIEAEATRLALGKPAEGTIILRAAHKGNFIIIEIIDDGAGIDPEKVLNKALQRGLVTREEAARLSKEDIINFIFAPGFSTAEQVTEVSGRGVGMDVVRTNLKKTKGSIRLSSESGQGTHIRLELPLTLAVVEVLLVRSAGSIFAVPLAAVLESVKLPRERLYTLMHRKAITLRGEVISVENLGDILGLGGKHEDDEQDAISIMILQAGGERLGIAVDGLMRQEDIVVKPLPEYLASLPGIAGAAILGDGRSILILDPAELFALATRKLAA